MDCGFLRLPAPPELETIFLERDNLRAILPPEHPLAALERVPLAALCDDPFLMLVKEGYFDGQEHIAFVHTGGAAALFAMDLG